MSIISNATSTGVCTSATENKLGGFHKYIQVRHSETVSSILADDQEEIRNGLLRLPKSCEIDLVLGTATYIKGGKEVLKVEKDSDLPYTIEFIGTTESGCRMYEMVDMK